MHVGNIGITPKHSTMYTNFDFSVNNYSECVNNTFNRNTYYHSE